MKRKDEKKARSWFLLTSLLESTANIDRPALSLSLSLTCLGAVIRLTVGKRREETFFEHSKLNSFWQSRGSE